MDRPGGDVPVGTCDEDDVLLRHSGCVFLEIFSGAGNQEEILTELSGTGAGGLLVCVDAVWKLGEMGLFDLART